MLIGERLRKLREGKELSQGDIENRSGVLRAYISRVEHGHTIPTILTLEKIASALEVPLGPCGNGVAAGRFALVALPRALSAPAALSGTAVACGKSFRLTASGPYRKTTIKSLQKCSSKPSLADISIWQKTGHFYFALTEAKELPLSKVAARSW